VVPEMIARKEIAVQQLASQDGEADIVDVRTAPEFRELHAAGAENVPRDALDPYAVMKDRNPDEPLYVICKSGARGARACQKFSDAGFSNVMNIEGGTQAWDAAGLPVVRGRKAVSLERQVRIAAGFLVLSGALATIVTGIVYLAFIPAFIGAGLMFAGVTDSCAMGMLIARMPWNRG